MNAGEAAGRDSRAPVALAVLGAGAWGTTLAWLLGEKGLQVRLWCRDAARAGSIQASRQNRRYLPGVVLPQTVRVTPSMADALREVEGAVVAVPAQAVRELLTQARSLLSDDVPVVLAAKGLEQSTGLRLSQVAAEVLGRSADRGGTGIPPAPAGVSRGPGTAETDEGRHSVAVLSGPNLSGELLRRLPTTTVIGSTDARLARRAQHWFATAFLRVYTNPDVVGVELGGALKNVIALGAGISDGLGFGDNAKAALITRGLAEIVRLGVRCGARPETFVGLSGLGDLVATCGSRLSRNHTLGVRLGRGEPLAAALEALGHVAEGVPTTAAALRLARAYGVEMPITEEIYRVLYEQRPAADAVAALMSRAYRDE